MWFLRLRNLFRNVENYIQRVLLYVSVQGFTSQGNLKRKLHRGRQKFVQHIPFFNIFVNRHVYISLSHQ